MIFSFTKDEEAKIKQFEERTIKELGLKGTRASDEWIEQVKKIDKAIVNEFKEMIDSFENERFSKLDSPKKILDNAKSTIEEAVIFTYNSLGITKITEKDNITIGSFTYTHKNYFYFVFNESAEAFLNFHIEHEKVPARIFTIEGMKTFLIKYAIKKHSEALKGTPEEQKLYKAINKCLEKSKYIHSEGFKGDFAIYEEKTPIYQGSYIDRFADVTKQEQIRDIGNNKIIIVNEEAGKEYTFKVSSPKGRFGITTDKLLLASGAEFTKINNYPHKKGSKINYTVKIPLRAYAERCGYDITEHPKATPQEREKEKARAQGKLKDARKQIKKDLELLFECSFSWSEKIKGKLEDFLDVRLIEAKGIKEGYIIVEFSRNYAEYLLKHPALTQFDNRLLLIDGNHRNAYYLGLKIMEHNSIYKNQERGTANLLKVKTLLEYTDLPNIEKVKAQENGWQGRIKERLENALDFLVSDIKILSDWRYSKAKGEELTAEEAANIAEYSIFENLYVYFTMNENEEVVI